MIEDVSVASLRVKSCSLSGALLRNVTVGGLTGDPGSLFINGCEFHNVTLSGVFNDLTIQTSVTARNPEERAMYMRRVAEADQGDDMALDIRGVEGAISIRGYSAHRIRIDPSFQAVVPRERAEVGVWDDIDFGGSHFGVALQLMMRQGWNDKILSANKRSRHFEDDVAIITELRRRGIAL
ncbi:hypothetical protein BWO91_14260 [Plantibacter flavus]|uniref:hypothetical protein n=1 Tax=Plantibacter flavus TaxID=150123 RepID=UPI00099C7108|nr:hypothetical protein [Plantibacter flavus]AQX80971.1 hypothetical protein BWO91_14260 [Plantibacter flavus]